MLSIRDSEWRQVLGLTLLLFLLCVSYCVLRNLKDAVTLTAHPSGAEVIPYLKVWGMLPGAILMAGMVHRLSQVFGRVKIFYLIMGCFLAYYWVYALLLVGWEAPLGEGVQERLEILLPSGARGWVSMVCQWPASLFYVLSELWASMMIAVLFWGATNHLLIKDQAERSYGIIKVGGTASAFVAGQLAAWIAEAPFGACLAKGAGSWKQMLVNELLLVTFLSLTSAFLFHRLFSSVEIQRQNRTARVRLSLVDSLRRVVRSPKLLSLASLVVGYNLVFNLSDILWKQSVHQHYQDPQSILAFMNQVMSWVGLLSLVATLSSGWIVRKWGWGLLAGATPVVMLLCSLAFFSCWFFGESLGLPAANCLLLIGACQNGLSKAFKYSVFDVSKEMAYTSLSQEERWEGKTLIDGVANDVGKTGSSLAHQSLLIACGTMSRSAPFICVLVIGSLFFWIKGVFFLSKDYKDEKIPV